MFTVLQCIRDYDDVHKHEVAEFTTEKEADDFVDAEERLCPWPDVWFEVRES